MDAGAVSWLMVWPLWSSLFTEATNARAIVEATNARAILAVSISLRGTVGSLKQP